MFTAGGFSERATTVTITKLGTKLRYRCHLASDENEWLNTNLALGADPPHATSAL